MVRPDKALGPRWQDRMPVGRALMGGILAGLFAGAVMLLLVTVGSGATDAGATWPLKLVAATWYGGSALFAGGGVVLVGLVTHFAVAALFGGLFGLTFGRLRSTRVDVPFGILFGFFVWALMTFLVVPSGNPPLAAQLAAIPWWWLSLHLVFGGLLGLSPALARSFAETTRTRGITEPKEMPI